jgi:hypothetical protein
MSRRTENYDDHGATNHDREIALLKQRNDLEMGREGISTYLPSPTFVPRVPIISLSRCRGKTAAEVSVISHSYNRLPINFYKPRSRHTKLSFTPTESKTKSWPGAGPARAAESGRFRACGTSTGCPGAGSPAAAGASKKSGEKIAPVLPGPYVVHSNTKMAPRSVWGLKALHTSTNDHISYRKPTTCTLLLPLAVRMHVTSTLTGVTTMSLMPIDCLYVQRRLLSVCLRRRRKNLYKSALAIYTEEMGNALSGSFRSMNAEVTRAHTPPIAYRTHSNTLQRLQVATGLSLVQVHAQDRG